MVNAGKRFILGWEKAPACEDGAQDHKFGAEKNIGRCRHEQTCQTCGVVREIDSSD